MIALSATALGVALTGALSTLRGIGAPLAPRRLLIVYALIAGLAALPLVIAFVPSLMPTYMAATLPMLLALPSALYFYVEGLTSPQHTGRPTLLHGILPLMGSLITFGYWCLPIAAQQTMFMNGSLPPGLFPATLAVSTFVLIAIWCLASPAYLLIVLKRLARFRARLRDLYSNVETRELRWVEWLMAFLVVLWVAVAATLLSDNFGPGLLVPDEWIMALTVCLLAFLFCTSPIRAVALEPDLAIDSAPDKPGEVVTEKYSRSSLTADHAQRLAERIETAMREHHLYLDANLSLSKLSRHVASAPNLVSQTLNERLGATFFDYVARWRVEAAEPLILRGQQSILTIALDVGFNSKSTFYKAFKKQMGMTPTAYRDARSEGQIS
jgi:AraC-like DNA-binding protein